jgi:hypothetical protein
MDKEYDFRVGDIVRLKKDAEILPGVYHEKEMRIESIGEGGRCKQSGGYSFHMHWLTLVRRPK